MPMYQFACRDCGEAFEKRLRMSQSGEKQTCPHCSSADTRKRISAVAVSGTASSAPVMSAPPPSSPFS